MPPRRFTRWAAIFFLAFFCLPVLVFCLAVDALLYLLFTEVFDTCYALLCLME